MSSTKRAPGREATLDGLRQRRARHEYTLVDEKAQVREPSLSEQICERLAIRPPPDREIERRRKHVTRRSSAPIDLAPPLQMTQQPERLVAGVVRAVAEDEVVSLEIVRERGDRSVAVARPEQPRFELRWRHGPRIILARGVSISRREPYAIISP
jgi:hypothetical protein